LIECPVSTRYAARVQEEGAGV
jgi:hypothetical protein